MKEAFFFNYTTILTLESISYWVHCCEQTLGNQIKEGRVGSAQTPEVESILTGNTWLQKPVGLSVPHQESQRRSSRN